ncbi:bifunctional folylpolyglutamate synthase/dihydrofolate synthase [Spirulina sp. CS-785/01]|uniref:bifunctional folylpolyglutamate synthase/dihydrofolate synthase n=1 Tax=Spirulina sp. CS-785/01 TaxID=3021716 RepID=UPI003FA6905A
MIDNPVTDLLNPFQRFGVHLGLDRINHLLDRLGNPQQQVPLVHVAGTNGKGSVCAYVSSVLTAAGYRVGCYTSPHLVDWTERIRMNGENISVAAFTAILEQVIAATDPHTETPTQFEVVTAAAWLYFAQQAVDVAVMEVGLGGRLDATNVCDTPLVTAITSISREHWQRLGDTLAKIAGEKAGILKPHRPVVVGQLPPEAAGVVKKRVEQLDCPAVWVTPARPLGEGKAEYAGIEYGLPLLGPVQLLNSAIAISTLQQLQQQGWDIPLTAMQTGLQHTQWTGRIQWREWNGYKLLVDGAHNPAAAMALRQYVDTLKPPITWVMGILETKDHREIFEALLRPQDTLYLVPVPDHATADPAELAELAQEVCPSLDRCCTYPDLFPALMEALETDQQVVLCGSLYLLGYFLRKTGG